MFACYIQRLGIESQHLLPFHKSILPTGRAGIRRARSLTQSRIRWDPDLRAARYLARPAPISPDFSNSIPDHKLEERFQLNFVVMPSELLREASSAAARGHFLKALPKWSKRASSNICSDYLTGKL